MTIEHKKDHKPSDPKTEIDILTCGPWQYPDKGQLPEHGKPLRMEMNGKMYVGWYNSNGGETAKWKTHDNRAWNGIVSSNLPPTRWQYIHV
jgi:hypothetical protein